jgi:uncharacterized Zn-finger protein
LVAFLKLHCGYCNEYFKIDPRAIDEDDEMVGCPYCERDVELPEVR